MKLSVVRRFELLASAEPVVHFTADGITGNSAAEVFLGTQAVLSGGEGSKPTISASYFHRVYDGGAPEVDFGSPSNSFLLLASADVKGFHYDANAIFNEPVQEPIRVNAKRQWPRQQQAPQVKGCTRSVSRPTLPTRLVAWPQTFRSARRGWARQGDLAQST